MNMTTRAAVTRFQARPQTRRLGEPRFIAISVLLLSLAGAAAVSADQAAATARAQFEAGEFDETLTSLEPAVADPAGDPQLHFLAVQSALRLEQPDRATRSLDALAANPDPAWQAVGGSIGALNMGNVAVALELAERAAAASPGLFAAQYQLGLVQARAEDWTGSAAAFERALAIDPGFAYASYYAGLAYSRLSRADKTAQHFERFLRLAPRAPERAGVQSIMRTLRGR